MRALAAALVLLPGWALAQAAPTPAAPPPDPPADKLALQQMLMQMLGENLQWRTQSIELQRRVDELQKQLNDTHPKGTP
jgi:hypothetical protein